MKNNTERQELERLLTRLGWAKWPEELRLFRSLEYGWFFKDIEVHKAWARWWLSNDEVSRYLEELDDGT